MSAIITPRIHSVEHEGFYYVETSDGVFGKGCRRCGGTGHYSFNGFDSICYLCGNVFEVRLGDIFKTREAAEKWCHERAVRPPDLPLVRGRPLRGSTHEAGQAGFER